MSQTSAALVLELKMCANIPNSFIESRWIYVPLKQDYIHMDIHIWIIQFNKEKENMDNSDKNCVEKNLSNDT